MKNIKKILEENKINIDEILFDNNKLIEIFNYRVSYLDSNDIQHEKLFIYDYLPLYIIEILESVNYNFKSLDSKKLIQIKQYCNLLYKYITKNPELICSNPILNIDEVNLIRLFGDQQIKEINNIYKSAHNISNKIYWKIINNKVVSKTELYFLINYFTSNIETKDKNFITAQGNLIKKILENDLDDSLRTKNFIMQFLAQRKFEELGFSIKIYFSSKLEEDNQFTLGCCDDNYILINEQRYKNVPMKTFLADYYFEIKQQKKGDLTMLDFIETLYHELWHAYQHYKIKQGIIDGDSLGHLENQLIEIYIDKKDYIRNYIYLLSEKDAEINGYKDTMLFYEKYLKTELLKLNKTLNKYKNKNEKEKIYSYKTDKKGMVSLNEVYVVKYIDEIIKKSPRLLKEYSGLKLIYDNNGNPVDIITLIDNVKRKGFEFEKYVIARILDNNLRNLNISNIKYESYKNMLYAFVHISKDTITAIDIINKKIEKDKQLKKHYFEIIRSKMFIIFQIYSFMQKNIKNINFDTHEINELYVMLDDCFMDLNSRMKKVGMNLNSEEIANYSLKKLIGEDNYGSNQMV